jgi:hypothetical protein
MSVVKSGNATHDKNCADAERKRQASVVSGASQATVRSAEVTYYQTCRTSAIANGVSPSQFNDALRELQGTAGA